MKCPHCNNELKYPEYAYSNTYWYHNVCTVKTDCCGKAVRLIPRFEVEVVCARGISVDDWGNQIDE